MAYINDKNLPYLVEKLSNADNIKINNNKHGSRVSTVINSLVTKSDNVTKALEQEVINDSYSFKVGTGDVNVSADVQDGFGEVGIKGVTYQNILGTRINPSDGVEKNNNTITFNKVAQTNCTAGFPDSLAQVDKTYTLIFDILENTIENPANGNVGKINIVSYNSGNYYIKYKETGHKKILLKQPATSTGKPYVEFYNSTSGKFVMTIPILLEGDHTNNSDLPSYFEGIVGVGDKSKNLFNSANLEIGTSEDVNGKTWSESKFPDLTRVRLINEINVKPNTTYTLNTIKKLNCVVKQFNAEGIGIADMSWTEMPYTFTTKTNTNSLVFMIKYGDDKEVKLDDIINAKIQLEEGSTSTNHQPYGTNVIDALSCGKNLWDLKNRSVKGYIEYPTGNLHKPDCENRTSNFIRVKPGITYTYMTTVDVFKESHPISWNAVAWYDKNYNFITRSVKTGEKMGVDTIIYTLTSPTNAAYARVGSRYLESDFSQATFSEGVISEHIPYVEDKTQILLDEPLMRLPNGVCDEITRDGILIRRVGKIVFNGSEDWKVALNADNITNRYDFKFDKFKRYDGIVDGVMPNMCCDSLPLETFTNIYQGKQAGLTHYWSNNNPQTITIGLKNSKTLTEFKQWLSQNPTTVYYELAKPIITEFPAPCLRIFKDGHIIFNTLIAPESNHVVQLNKSAQIERSIREVQSLDNRVGQLESFYDNMMLETSYKLNLLNYDFKYTKEREDK